MFLSFSILSNEIPSTKFQIASPWKGRAENPVPTAVPGFKKGVPLRGRGWISFFESTSGGRGGLRSRLQTGKPARMRASMERCRAVNQANLAAPTSWILFPQIGDITGVSRLPILLDTLFRSWLIQVMSAFLSLIGYKGKADGYFFRCVKNFVLLANSVTANRV